MGIMRTVRRIDLKWILSFRKNKGRLNMSPVEFRDRMAEIAKRSLYDPEESHGKADDLMCEILTNLGYGEGVKIFEEMDKWYA